MAIIGFILCIIIALWLTFAPIGMNQISYAFSGTMVPQAFLLWIPAAALWYYIYTHSPISISFAFN